jgi:hypothetical protein
VERNIPLIQCELAMLALERSNSITGINELNYLLTYKHGEKKFKQALENLANSKRSQHFIYFLSQIKY